MWLGCGSSSGTQRLCLAQARGQRQQQEPAALAWAEPLGQQSRARQGLGRRRRKQDKQEAEAAAFPSLRPWLSGGAPGAVETPGSSSSLSPALPWAVLGEALAARPARL